MTTAVRNPGMRGVYMGAMAHWIIGDVHGCWFTLQRLLDRIAWDPAADTVWFVGDLVNKGKYSLDVLRWAASAGPRVGCVLGNLDLHLLVRAEGLAPRRPQDTLEAVLNAPDREELLLWLRGQPFIRRREGTVVVHAGLMPSWTIAHAERLAAECTEVVVGGAIADLWHGRKTSWRRGLEGKARVAAAAGVLTRVRMVGRNEVPLLLYAGGLEGAPDGSKPWFDGSAVLGEGHRVVFGHWACLGFVRTGRFLCLDSGCVYGGELTAVDLDREIVVQEPCDPEDRLR